MPVTGKVRPPSTIRGVLVVGFASVFALWVISGYELVRNLAAVEQRVAEVHGEYLRGQHVLATIRTSVLLGSVYLRDALIDTGAITREYYRDELNQIRDDIEQLLPAYMLGVHAPIERQQWALLQTELADYWDSRDVVFGPDMPRTSSESANFLRRRVIPRRDTILRIVDRLAALQQIALERHQIETSLLYGELRNRLLAIGGLSIVLGLIVAGLATRHVGRLEREIDRRRLADQQNQRDLERLSARLVHAQEEERRVIARELHDEVGQALTAIKMELGAARRVEGDLRARSSLDEARSIAESALHSVRDMSQLLHPSMLDDLGLPDTIDTYLRSFSKRTGIRAQLTHERMEERLPADIEVGAYRIVQEALTNVAKHSGASACTVRLVRREGLLSVTIEDDGSGIDPQVSLAGDARRGLGLIGMRERAAALSGEFEVGNRDEGGTKVTVRLPVETAPAQPGLHVVRRIG